MKACNEKEQQFLSLLQEQGLGRRCDFSNRAHLYLPRDRLLAQIASGRFIFRSQGR